MNCKHIAQYKSDSYTTRHFDMRLVLIGAVFSLPFFSVACTFAAQSIVAEAYFEVDVVQPTVFPHSGVPFDASEYKIYQSTQLALIKCPFVLNAALREPGIATSSVLASVNDPLEWLAGHIQTEFVGQSTVMAIRLQGVEDQADQLRQLVDAVTHAYQNEVVFAESVSRRLDPATYRRIKTSQLE
jgi:hypothetical protein